MDFTVAADFQAKPDWINRFARAEVEPLDLLFPPVEHLYDTHDRTARALAEPLRQQLNAQGLWACHLPPELGGKGYGQLMLALMDEIIGRCAWVPAVFGRAAPDTGNAKILAQARLAARLKDSDG